MPAKIMKEYTVESDGVKVKVQITKIDAEFVLSYVLDIPEYEKGTAALLATMKKNIISDANIRTEKMLDPEFIKTLKNTFRIRALAILSKEVPQLPQSTRESLAGILLHEMLGLGKIEFLISDDDLEEIVINQAKHPVWVYHKEFGWLKTNIEIPNEAEVHNYASIIARRIGKQITILNPLLDAHLITGDRANATLSPISSKGNTITLRRFKRSPWTVTDFIKNDTVSAESIALIWLAMQFEMNIIVSGGTGSGKTSFLNVCMPFIQPNQRILSIEDTREIQLSDFQHWVPLTTREPNPEGKGEVSMLDLLVNYLRMRPDRIIVGEILRQREAEVMFEAMHTGHSVYTTFHANTAEETIRRMINPPIEVPSALLESVNLNVVMFRNRRLGVRKMLELAEYIPEKGGEKYTITANVLYRWNATTNHVEKHSESIRFFDELSLHTGLSKDDLESDLHEKEKILNWMVKNDIHDISDVGKVIANYYLDREATLKMIEKNKKVIE
mgnify:FL=1